jgi:hypothetical protein
MSNFETEARNERAGWAAKMTVGASADHTNDSWRLRGPHK